MLSSRIAGLSKWIVTYVECGDLSPLSSLTMETSIAVKPWPHAPVHRLTPSGVYMVTAATLRKELLFRGAERLTLLEDRLLSFAKKYNWQLEAWAVFPNHYHFVARSEDGAVNLKRFVIHLHADTARELNRMDQAEGRKVWYNFWDTKLTYQAAYLPA